MTHPTNPAYDDQTYMVEFEVPGALDGVTFGPEIRAPAPNQDPQSIYRPEVPGNLGLIDPDYVVEDGLDRHGTRGNRFIGIVWIDASVAGDVDAVIEVVDAVDGTVLVQEQIASLAGLTTYYNKEGFVVPQGSLIRISGFAAGLEPHRVRLFISYLTEKEVVEVQKESMGQSWATVLANGNVSGGINPVISEGDVLSLQGNADLLSDTLDNLQNKGTDDGIVAEQTVAWSKTNLRWVYALTAAPGSSTWGYRFSVVYRLGNAFTDALEFPRWQDATVRAGAIAYTELFLMPFPGIIKTIHMRPDSAITGGDTTVGIHIGANGSDPVVAPPTKSTTLALDTLKTARIWAPEQAFAADSVVALSVDGDGVVGNLLTAVEIEFIKTAV